MALVLAAMSVKVHDLSPMTELDIHTAFSSAIAGDPVQLTTGPLNFGSPVPSRDGKKLFVQGWQPRAEMVRYEAKSGAFLPFSAGTGASPTGLLA